MSEQTRITLTIVGGVCLFFNLLIAGLVWRYYGLMHRHSNARLSYLSIEGRCRCITEAVEEAWPDISELRGEEYIHTLRNRMKLAEELNRIVREKLAGPGDREDKSHFVSIEAVKRAAFMLESYNRMGQLLVMPPGLSSAAGDMVFNFAKAMLEKLAQTSAQRIADHGDPDGWAMRHDTWPMPECQEALLEAVAKGDPVDVGNYAAFLHFHGEETSLMGYMSMTPALESVVRQVMSGVELDTLNLFATREARSGVRSNSGPLFMGAEEARKWAKRLVSRAHELGRINSRVLHELYALADSNDPVLAKPAHNMEDVDNG